MHEYYIWSSLWWNHGLFPFPVLTRTDNQQILHIFIFFYTLLLFALICQSFNWSSCAVHFLAIFLVMEKVFAISQHKKSQIVIIKGNWRKGQKYYSGRDILIKPFLSLLLLYKVNRCLARYSPRATTTNWPTNRAPKKPAWPGPYRPKNANFWAKNPFFYLRNHKFCYPHNGKLS